MYNQKLAVAVKSNGKVLREFKDTVYVPFGCEYSLLIKNLNSVRVLANIKIDGQDVVPGGLVLYANQEIDLERWIKNGNMNQGNKFKFIERTGDVEEARGIKLEDGIIQIEYQFEKPYVAPVVSDWQWKQTFPGPSYPSPWYGSTNNTAGSWADDVKFGSSTRSMMKGIGGSASGSTLTSTASVNQVQTMGASFSNEAVSKSLSETVGQAFYNDAGITVPGSKSEQKFSTASWFPTEAEKHSMVIKLLGETPDNKPVTKPVTVKAKQKCTTCNHLNKATAHFCNKCGTALEIYA